MAKGDAIGTDEAVVRAFRHPYWDSENNRGTPSAFTEVEVSVCRLAILNLEQIVAIFKSDFDRRVDRDGHSMQIRGIGRALVSDILRQTDEPTDIKSNELPDVVLTVNEDRIVDEPGVTDNPAHALIRGWKRADPTQARRIPKSVAKRLLNLFGFEACSSEGLREGSAAGDDATPT